MIVYNDFRCVCIRDRNRKPKNKNNIETVKKNRIYLLFGVWLYAITNINLDFSGLINTIHYKSVEIVLLSTSYLMLVLCWQWSSKCSLLCDHFYFIIYIHTVCVCLYDLMAPGLLIYSLNYLLVRCVRHFFTIVIITFNFFVGSRKLQTYT